MCSTFCSCLCLGILLQNIIGYLLDHYVLVTYGTCVNGICFTCLLDFPVRTRCLDVFCDQATHVKARFMNL